MNYPEALAGIIAGAKMTRSGWNGAGQFIEADDLDSALDMV